MAAPASAAPLAAWLLRWLRPCIQVLHRPIRRFSSSPSHPVGLFLVRLYFLCICPCINASLFVMECIVECELFCRRLISNLQFIVNPSHVQHLFQLLKYYCVFCCLVSMFSIVIRQFAAVLASLLLPPCPNFDSLPSLFTCCCLALCCVLGFVVIGIRKQGWLSPTLYS